MLYQKFTRLQLCQIQCSISLKRWSFGYFSPRTRINLILPYRTHFSHLFLSVFKNQIWGVLYREILEVTVPLLFFFITIKMIPKIVQDAFAKIIKETRKVAVDQIKVDQISRASISDFYFIFKMCYLSIIVMSGLILNYFTALRITFVWII